MNRTEFINNFANNLKKNIDKHFKTQKEFADFFNESTKVISSWCNGKALPDLFKINKICESMGITVDYLIKGEPTGVTSTSIDYIIFDEVVKLTNDFAKEIHVKVGGRQYLAVYENVVNLKRLNHKLTTKEIFESLRPTLNTWKK